MKRPAGKAASAKTTFKVNTSTRPQSHFTKKDLILVASPNLPVWPRLRTALGVTVFVHFILLLALLYLPKREASVIEEITAIKFEDEAELPRQRATQRSVESMALLKEEPRRALLPEKKLQEKMGGSGPQNDERGSQQELVTRMRETNPNAGGSSLSDNIAFDLPSKLGALNPGRPQARGAGSRSRAGTGAQIKVEAAPMRDTEASDLSGDFTSNAVAATSAFRNRTGAPGNGLGKNNFGVGIDLGKGTGAGISEGENEGGLWGAQGGGANLGGGGYGRRAGRGAGNGVGEGLGNGVQIGIAAGLGGEGGAMSMNDLISWMKTHPGALPKLVQYDMEHKPGDLSSAIRLVRNGKSYELFLSCNAADMLLRICLIEGNKFTMLKDNGIKEASNFLAMGEVVRTGSAIQSLITSRQAPGETAPQFYKIFWSWWEREKK